MKNTIYPVCLALCFLSLSHFTRANEKIPEFSIKSRSIQPTIANDSALLVFTFFEETSISNNLIYIGINHESFNATPDKNGTYTKKIKSGTYKLYFYIPGYKEVITDSIKIKSQEKIVADIHFPIDLMMMKPAKPVIYVYPEKEMAVNIQLDVIGQLGFTYPAYNEGWNFIASPNGNIQMNDKEYNYLFWESEMPAKELIYDNTSGFLVSSDTLLSFLENSLSQMGLNSKEAADFITYWYPQMQINEKNHIHFLFNDQCNTYASLTIAPKPDHVFRVGMIWAEAKSDFIPQPQVFEKMSRDGFTVLEWGGMINNALFIINN